MDTILQERLPVLRFALQSEFKAVITLLQLRFEKVSPVTFMQKWLPGTLEWGVSQWCRLNSVTSLYRAGEVGVEQCHCPL